MFGHKVAGVKKQSLPVTFVVTTSSGDVEVEAETFSYVQPYQQYNYTYGSQGLITNSVPVGSPSPSAVFFLRTAEDGRQIQVGLVLDVTRILPKKAA